MGAALHLAHVHQAPVKKRRPRRTGGGNGSEVDLCQCGRAPEMVLPRTVRHDGR